MLDEQTNPVWWPDGTLHGADGDYPFASAIDEPPAECAAANAAHIRSSVPSGLVLHQGFNDGWHGLVLQAVQSDGSATCPLHGLEYQAVPLFET